MKISVGLVDDHQLFLNSLALLISGFGSFDVVVQAGNGKDLIKKITEKNIQPDIMLIDVNMPVMGGAETAAWCLTNIPTARLVALSTNDDDKSIISMLKAGCCSYILKDTSPEDFYKGLNEIYTKGFYNSDACNINYRRLLQKEDEIQLNDRERRFLDLACSELTYKKIASLMNLSERTIDGYREALFEKLNVQSRVGMCLEALRRGFVKLKDK
jgi:DNA-binding NarL/FixJ family response regulator